MDSKNIFIVILVIFAVGFSIYRKYARKNQQGAGGISNVKGQVPQVNEKDDDYEPYSGK